MKFLYMLMCAVCSLNVYAASNIKLEKTSAGQLACQKTILAYPQLRDNGPIKEYGALFSENAKFEVKKLNILLQGRTQITKRLKKALQTTKTKHIITNVDIKPVSNSSFKAYSSFTLDLQNLLPEKSASITIKGFYDDLLQFDGTHCLITSRQVIVDVQQP